MSRLIDVSTINESAYNLKDFLDKVLAKTVETFEEHNVPLPTRQYWTMGEPAVDCEQLVVGFIQMYLGLPGDEASQPQRCSVPRSAVLRISISRQIPVVGVNGKAPSADKIQEASEIAAIDAWMFMELINKLDQWQPGEFGLGVIATTEASTAEGGFQTMNMQVTLAVP
jgi:hypothetical protein